MRGKEVSRLEAFSDILFGFALTLLVVALEVPENFDGLMTALRGFPAFAATFTVAIWLWYNHYRFFRTFAMEDGATIFINSLLMFVVLFYVYPLKFVFAGMLGPADTLHELTTDQGRFLIRVYDLGFIAIFGLLGTLHWNGLRLRERYSWDALERFDLGAGVRTHLVSAGVGVGSLILTFVLPGELVGVAGFFFFLLGPVHWANGVMVGRKRKALVAELAG
ncbi:MAG: TMEM175 family protein [Vicinamibacterales bacterium]